MNSTIEKIFSVLFSVLERRYNVSYRTLDKVSKSNGWFTDSSFGQPFLIAQSPMVPIKDLRKYSKFMIKALLNTIKKSGAKRGKKISLLQGIARHYVFSPDRVQLWVNFSREL